jgi:glycerol-3-phosphate acyltransferase PlsY
MFLGLAWPVGLASFGVFLLTLWIFRIVSLSSVLAAVSLPLLMIRFSGIGSYVLIALVAMGLVLWRHRSNLSRILDGSEPKIGQKD